MASNTKNHILKEYIPAIISVVFLLFGIYLEFISETTLDELYLIIIYAIAYLPVGFPVVWRSLKLITRLDIFNEFFLMSIATIGAISIGEYAEGVAVLLFYSVGELFQGGSSQTSKKIH
jgi:Cd2+/Zn2+-exporting ATPase